MGLWDSALVHMHMIHPASSFAVSCLGGRRSMKAGKTRNPSKEEDSS